MSPGWRLMARHDSPAWERQVPFYIVPRVMLVAMLLVKVIFGD